MANKLTYIIIIILFLLSSFSGSLTICSRTSGPSVFNARVGRRHSDPTRPRPSAPKTPPPPPPPPPPLPGQRVRAGQWERVKADPVTPPGPNGSKIDGSVPTVKELKEVIQHYDTFQKGPCAFWAKMAKDFPDENPPDVIEKWFKTHQLSQQSPVHYDNIVDGDWRTTKEKKIRILQGGEKVGLFQRHLSQAFAEMCEGHAYVFLPIKHDISTDEVGKNTWKDYEFPALTRNPAIESITSIYPLTGKQGGVIWKKGNPPTHNEPLKEWPVRH